MSMYIEVAFTGAKDALVKLKAYLENAYGLNTTTDANTLTVGIQWKKGAKELATLLNGACRAVHGVSWTQPKEFAEL